MPTYLEILKKNKAQIEKDLLNCQIPFDTMIWQIERLDEIEQKIKIIESGNENGKNGK